MLHTISKTYDVQTPNGNIQYCVVYKKIRYMYFRVNDDGCVIVSCNRTVSKGTIERAIHKMSAKIKRLINSKILQIASIPTYTNDDTLYYGGEKYTLKIDTNQENQLKIDTNSKTITANTATSESIRDLYLEQLKSNCKVSIEIALNKFLPYFAARGARPDKIIHKQQVSKWGYCKTNNIKGETTICFNTMLGMATNATIEYVVAHELTHMLVPNHSIKFYQELAKIVPQYLSNKAELKQYDLRGILSKDKA